MDKFLFNLAWIGIISACIICPPLGILIVLAIADEGMKT